MKNIIGVYGVFNTAAVLVYDIRYGVDDEVLAGFNDEEPTWCTIVDDPETGFYLWDMFIPMGEVMRV